jgi:hypothetical protein
MNEGYFYFTTKQKINTHEASTREAVQISLENQDALKKALKQQSESLEALVKRTNLQDEPSRVSGLGELPGPAADVFSTIASNLALPVKLPTKTLSSSVSSAAQHIAESGRSVTRAASSLSPLPPIFPSLETKKSPLPLINPSQKSLPHKEPDEPA